MTEKEKMLRGELYNANYDQDLIRERNEVKNLCAQYNRLDFNDSVGRKALLRRIILHMENDAWIEPSFWCDYGYNIRMGKNFYANFNFTCLDCCPVTIGDNVFFGPGVSLLTPVHPFRWQERNPYVKQDGTVTDSEYAKPINIGSNCWLAGNVTVCGGVTIGEGCVIGAGSVVTRDIPPDSLAVGVPCRVIRKITDADRMKARSEF